MSAPRALTGTTRVRAERLIEALFPAGESLPPADVAGLLAAVDEMIAGNAALVRGVAALLAWPISAPPSREGKP